MFNRTLANKLPSISFFLFGPRQIGKTTLLKKLKLVLLLDLLNPSQQLEYTKDPGLLRQQVDALDLKKGTILIDEVQRVPALLDVVHGLIELYPDLQFILCGSSARKLRHGAANLLGGRALYRTLHPLSIQELASDFDLNLAINYGTLPKIYGLLLKKKMNLANDLLRSYVITYLQEEIKAESLVRNLQGFQNFLDVAGMQFAQPVNFSEIGRECSVAYSTVKEYYSILEDTLIGFFLRPYLKSERKRMGHSSKFYFFDNGVTRALLGSLKDKPNRFERGFLFEQWIIQEIHRLSDYHQKNWRFSFWKTSHGAEVDLIIEDKNKPIFGIECKYKRKVSPADLSGIRAFRKDHPKVPCYVAAPLETPIKLGEIKVLPPRLLLEKIFGMKMG